MLTLKVAEVLAWYSIVLHRHDVRRTENWRNICNAELQAYFTGEEQHAAEIWGGDKSERISVRRGACEQAALQMMKQDCDRLIATRNFRPSDCEFVESAPVPKDSLANK
jgi:hypothetical protein